MSIRSDIKLLDQINATLLLGEKIQKVEKQHNLSQNSSLDIDYKTVLEMLCIYKDIITTKPFVKAVSQNSKTITYPDLFDKSLSPTPELISDTLQKLKENIVVDYMDISQSVESKYKKSGAVITKYGYDNRQPLLPQIKARINSFQHPTSLLGSSFDTNKITSVRQCFSDNRDNNLSLKLK